MSLHLLLAHEVETRARLSASSIWRMERLGLFPKRIKIGMKRVAWSEAEIEAWLKERMDARDR